MKYPQGHLEVLFDDIAGQQGNIDSTKDRLIKAVHQPSAHSDPYTKLSLALDGVLLDTASNRAAEAVNGASSKKEEKELKLDWSIVHSNGRSGARLLTATLRAVGEVYANEAEVPQAVPNLRTNTYRALRYVYSMALDTRGTAFANLSGMRFGADPNRRITPIRGALLGPAVVNRPKVSKDSFKSVSDDLGQISLKPRHPRRPRQKPRAGKGCPAPFTKLHTPEGKKPALITLAKMLGDIAIEEIFPTQFPVAKIYDQEKNQAI